MIEWIQTPTRDWVPLDQGIQLASRRDPRREAERWVKKMGSRCGEYPTLFVIGVGAALHLKALKESWPRAHVIGIDNTSALIERHLKVNHDATLCYAHSLDDLLKFENVKNAMSKLYGVLIFLPAVRHKMEFANRLQSQLLGRDPESLRVLASLRAGVGSHFNEFPISISDSGDLKRQFVDWMHAPERESIRDEKLKVEMMILRELVR